MAQSDQVEQVDPETGAVIVPSQTFIDKVETVYGHEPTVKDLLSLGNNKKIDKMLYDYGACFPSKEKVIYSNKITKINQRKKKQQRILLITDKAIYNLMPTDYSKCRRRIELENVESITQSVVSLEFVLHVPQEYDYRYQCNKELEVKDIIESISNAKRRKCHEGVNVIKVSQADLFSIMRAEDPKGRNKSIFATIADSVMKQRERRYIELKKNMDISESEYKEYLQDSATTESTMYNNGSNNNNNSFGGNNNNNNGLKISVNDFDLLKVIGRGSFGKVMQVRKKDSNEVYAMKILSKNYIIKRNQIEHTIGERQILEACDHPFLMHLRYAFQTQQKLYLVLDYYRGGELFFHLKKRRKFSYQCGKIWVAETAMALGYLHDMDVIYRDLKPENILLDDDGHICLTDFGLSKELEENYDMAYTFCGTPEYLAPEIILNSGHTRSVDWWSLGILLYELTVGIPPFYAPHPNDMYNKIQHDPIQFPTNMPIQCQSLISLLLERNISKRLGAGPDDVKEIERHAFFKDLDWKKLYNKEIESEYRPDVKKSNFEKQFTNEPVVDTYSNKQKILDTNNDKFLQFTYAGDNSALDDALQQ